MAACCFEAESEFTETKLWVSDLGDEPLGSACKLASLPMSAGANRRVVYSLAHTASGFFSIDSSSGIIMLEQPLDREQQASYNLTVRASDLGPGQALSSLTTVTITVLDVNDNPPVFERRDYLVTVPEDASPGTQVLTVFATSKDIGTNAEITYLIRSGNEQGKFQIHPQTGEPTARPAQLTATCRHGVTSSLPSGLGTALGAGLRSCIDGQAANRQPLWGPPLPLAWHAHVSKA